VLGLAFGPKIVGGIDNTFMDLIDGDDKSFMLSLHKNPDESYMVIPGKDFSDILNNAVDTHHLAEKSGWSLELDYLQQGAQPKILSPGFMAQLETSTSLISGPKSVIGPLIDGITVNPDCSGLDTLPDIHFAIDGLSYSLSGEDYVTKVTDTKKKTTSCQLGIVATDASDKYIHLGTQFITKVSPVYFNYDGGYVQFTRKMAEESAGDEFVQVNEFLDDLDEFLQ